MSSKSKQKEVEILGIRIDLKEPDLNYFLSLKSKIAKTKGIGIENIKNTDIVREAIQNYDIIYGDEAIVIESDLIKKIKKLLKSPSFQIEYPMNSIHQLFKFLATKLIKEWETKRKNLRENLYEILSTLNPAHRKIAMLISQLSQKKEEITLDIITKRLKVDSEIIQKALNTLISDGYIDMMEFEGKFIYWVN